MAWVSWCKSNSNLGGYFSDGYRGMCSFPPFITAQQWEKRGLGKDSASPRSGTL